MGEKKNNIRSFRYSDRVAEILEGMEGKNLNEKFENLVLTCYCKLPDIIGEIEREERHLRYMRDDYMELLEMKYRIESKLKIVDSLVADIDGAVSRNTISFLQHADPE